MLSEKLVRYKINISDCWKLRVTHWAYPYETNEKNIFIKPLSKLLCRLPEGKHNTDKTIDISVF